jgi:hypothetical protein
VAGPVFKTGEGQRELSLASSIPVLYRQLFFHQKTASLLQGLAAAEVPDAFLQTARPLQARTCSKKAPERQTSACSGPDDVGDMEFACEIREPWIFQLSSAFDDTKIPLRGLVEHFEGWPVQVTIIRSYRLL